MFFCSFKINFRSLCLDGLYLSSCAGPQTYREHLEGQKHKKREAATKMAASVAVTSQNRAGNSLRCQLCDVTCTGNDFGHSSLKEFF